jgi:putative Ca2+/H+ antiporter (TMEM165/GDT1 family)
MHWLEACAVSFGALVLAEMGDKTQFLTMLLAARYHRVLPILLGIVASTLVSQGMAVLVGQLLGHLLTPERMRWIVGLSMLAVALWTLRPAQPEEEEAAANQSARNAFTATFFAFLIGEMGDRTQFATAALAARYESFLPVLIGSTLGMVAANLPALWLGRIAAGRIPMKAMRYASAALFAAIGVWILVG